MYGDFADCSFKFRAPLQVPLHDISVGVLIAQLMSTSFNPLAYNKLFSEVPKLFVVTGAVFLSLSRNMLKLYQGCSMRVSRNKFSRSITHAKFK